MSVSEIIEIPEVSTEAIVVVDLVESASTSNVFGWYAVGRSLKHELRTAIRRVGDSKGLQCLKSTGDGYLLTFRDAQSAETAVLSAVESAFKLLELTEKRNQSVPDERTMNLRFAIHLGEVDIIENDRDGPHVSYTFRLEAITRASLTTALNPIPPEQLPLRNYILCSEEVADILSRRANCWRCGCIGLLKFKGFPGWREVFHVLPEPPQ